MRVFWEGRGRDCRYVCFIFLAREAGLLFFHVFAVVLVDSLVFVVILAGKGAWNNSSGLGETRKRRPRRTMS